MRTAFVSAIEFHTQHHSSIGVSHRAKSKCDGDEFGSRCVSGWRDHKAVPKGRGSHMCECLARYDWLRFTHSAKGIRPDVRIARVGDRPLLAESSARPIVCEIRFPVRHTVTMRHVPVHVLLHGRGR